VNEVWVCSTSEVTLNKWIMNYSDEHDIRFDVSYFITGSKRSALLSTPDLHRHIPKTNYLSHGTTLFSLTADWYLDIIDVTLTVITYRIFISDPASPHCHRKGLTRLCFLTSSCFYHHYRHSNWPNVIVNTTLYPLVKVIIILLFSDFYLSWLT